MDKEEHSAISEKLTTELLVEIRKYDEAIASQAAVHEIEDIKTRKEGLVKQLKDLWSDGNQYRFF